MGLTLQQEKLRHGEADKAAQDSAAIAVSYLSQLQASHKREEGRLFVTPCLACCLFWVY